MSPNNHQIRTALRQLQSPDAVYRRYAVLVLRSRSERDVTEALLHVLRQDPDPKVRVAALEGLADQESAEVWEAIRDALDAPHQELQLAVARALLQRGEPEDIEAVCRRLSEFDRWVRMVLAPRLLRLDSPHALAALCVTLPHAQETAALAKDIARRAKTADPTRLREAREILRDHLVRGHDTQPVRQAMKAVEHSLGLNLPVAGQPSASADPRLPYPAVESAPMPVAPPPDQLKSLVLEPLPIPNERRKLAFALGGLALIVVLVTLFIAFQLAFFFHTDFIQDRPYLLIANPAPYIWLIPRLWPVWAHLRRTRLELHENRLAVTSQLGPCSFLRRTHTYQLTRESRVRHVTDHGRKKPALGNHLALLTTGNRIVRFDYGATDAERTRRAEEINAYLESLHQAMSPVTEGTTAGVDEQQVKIGRPTADLVSC